MSETSAATPSTPSDRGARARAGNIQRVFRLYSSPAGQPRTRRATDVVVLVAVLIGLGLLIAAYPPSRFELSFEDFVASFPGWLDSIWDILYDLLSLWALVLLIAIVVRWRKNVVLQGLGSVVLAVALAMVSARLAVGHWPDLGAAIEGGSGSPPIPGMRLAECGAFIVTVAPYLVRPLQTVGCWIFVLALIGAVFSQAATLGAALASAAVAAAAAAGVRLVFGTSIGRPGLSDVGAALSELGVPSLELEAAEEQVAGVFIVHAQDADGRPLLVKVYGRDAYDNQLLAKLWRTIWYRDAGPALGLSRSQQAEHEAFVVLLARNARVPTREVVTAGTTAEGDALLVLRGAAQPLAALSADDLGGERLRRAWRSLALLAGTNIAHRDINPVTLVLVDDDVGLVDFAGATVAPDTDQLRTDQAQLLATTATIVGGEQALGAALDSLGEEGVAALLPYLQPAAFSGPLRQALKSAKVDVDGLRKEATEAVGATATELVKLRRVTWWSVIQIALLMLAASAIIGAASNVDWAELKSDLADASWGWVALGFVVAQLPRLTQAVAMLGSVAAKLPFVPVYIKELATCYLNLAMPSSLARMTVNIRFFQCQGLTGAAAVTSGAIDSFANNVVQAVLIILLLLFSQASLSIDLSAPSSGGPGTLLWIVVGLLVATVLVVVFVRRVRRAVVGRVRIWWPEVRTALGALRASHKLVLLVGGNVASEFLFSASLGLFAHAFGYQIPFAELLLINESVALLSSFIPVPGGIGVVEFGLMVGLTSAGMTQSSALATIFLYRLSTFYLPPIWGFFALRWLQRNKYL